MKYTIRQLEIFVSIARAQSVSRAASALALSQSAASTGLREFERQFNCQLFDRVGKMLKLNELGSAILPKATALLHQATEIENVLQGKVNVGLVKVGATSTIGNYLAMLLIGSYMKRHKECQIQLQVQNTNPIVEQVLHYDLDLGLIEGNCRHPELVVEPWIEDELVVFCSPNHPLSKCDSISLDNLSAETWILREPSSGTRQTFDQAMQQHGAPVHVRLVHEHTEAIKSAVETGLGISCLSRLALKDAFRRRSLVPIKTPMLDLRRQFMFVWNKNKYQTTCTKEFLDHCRDISIDVHSNDEIVTL